METISPQTLAAVQGTNLCTYLEESTARFPQRPAAVDPDGTTLTYEELNQRANRIARYLVDHGVAPGDRVALLMPKTTVTFALLYGIMKARAGYVPVDWNGPVERARSILASCEVKLAFADPRWRGLTGDTDPAIVSLDAATWDAILQLEPLEINPAARQPDDLAFILYTSGSSGIPKGVITTQRNATAYVDWCSWLFGGDEQDNFGNHAPFHFAMSIVDMFLPMKHGASVHLVPEELGKNPKELAGFISNHRISVWYSTPAILGLLAEFGNLSRLDFSSLRMVFFAGEPFQIKKLRLIMELWPTPVFHNLWGSTETNACTYQRIPRPIPEDRVTPYPIGPAGSHCMIMVLDDNAQPVAPGGEGLMYITGPSVFKGYWGRETVFLERHGGIWHNTGDVVKEQEGEGFVYVGRRDRMVKRRGFRIELAEVERGLYQHPAMSEAAVIALPDLQAGTKIIAYLVVPQEPKPSIVEMKTFCNQHLPVFMNPDVFVFTDALPRTRSNKVDYQALIRKAQAESGTATA